MVMGAAVAQLSFDSASGLIDGPHRDHLHSPSSRLYQLCTNGGPSLQVLLEAANTVSAPEKCT